MITDYEFKSKEKVSDNTKVATVLSHGPDGVVSMLRSPERSVRQTWPAMMQAIKEFAGNAYATAGLDWSRIKGCNMEA